MKEGTISEGNRFRTGFKKTDKGITEGMAQQIHGVDRVSKTLDSLVLALRLEYKLPEVREHFCLLFNPLRVENLVSIVLDT